MQLWFAHRSAVTLREQLVTQFVLGILSGDLQSGQRLPSTRELARRFRLHPNTVSAGYRQLEQERWVEFRRGSGVYVRDLDGKPDGAPIRASAADQILAELFRSARKMNVPLGTLRARLRRWLEWQPPDRFLLLEQDEELRRILAAEVQAAVTLPVKSCGVDDPEFSKALDGAIPVTLPNSEKKVREALPEGAELFVLQLRSVPASLASYLPAPTGALVGIASRYEGFLKLARTFLLAAGFHADSLVLRDARKQNWQRGLKETAAVVCDSLTAANLPKKPRVLPFLLLSEASLEGLQRYEEFVRSPLTAQM
jgi:DNA-binding transcriptional regulator YhcF (GntR family)